MVQLVSSACTFVGIVAMMIYLSPTMFLIACIFLVVMLIVVTNIARNRENISATSRKTSA
ncbi:MAG: hypothetical protein LUG95_00880 [Clostridiales bacterium]|nr:hypothetical protein [Clostridiales bacterium]